ncbi:DsbE family thiol:disulfide interchange protein [Polaromonas hydrogenivorans]|uniref:DsbE family thiol:disulfide interchange protein n=1 Tax=Polaromonas hydrogenivorans TaxID=335476 RepID=A0AAU7LSV3_9BURK
MRRFLFPLGLFFSLVCLLGAGLRLNPQEIPSPLIGKPAPAFALAQLALPDKTFGPQDMQGQVWLLNVWASWCTACRQEHPLLLELAGRNQVSIVGMDYMDARADGAKWLEKHGNPYRLSILDSDGKVGIDYGVYGVPETFVIDKRGVIRLKLAGPVTAEIIEKKLLPLIKELNRA